jgi:hypothetical protein
MEAGERLYGIYDAIVERPGLARPQGSSASGTSDRERSRAWTRSPQAEAGSGSGRTKTVSATWMTSSTGRSAFDACWRMASSLLAW